MYLGEDRISSTLRGRPSLASGFVKIESHGVRQNKTVHVRYERFCFTVHNDLCVRRG